MTRTSKDPQARQHRTNCRDLVVCPFCGAEAGQKCIGAKGQPRYASHVERWQLFDPAYVAAKAERGMGLKRGGRRLVHHWDSKPSTKTWPGQPASVDEFEVMGN